jgi:hypothetical protein
LALGGGWTTPRAAVWPWGGFDHPKPTGLGGQSHPQGQTVALGGGPGHPKAILKKKKKDILKYYYLFF